MILSSYVRKCDENHPGGSYLVMKNTPRSPSGRPLLAIGYTCSYRKFLGFISTERAGNTEAGDLCLSSFPDIYSNFSVHPVVLPHLLDINFNACNEIYNHNKM